MEQQSKEKPMIEVTHNFNAGPSAVFKAWLDTDRIAKWMFGPEVRQESIIRLENSPEVGGTFSYVVERNGDQLDHTGTYLDIRPNEQLVFTWGIGREAAKDSIVSIDISPIPSGCQLVLAHQMDPKWADYAERTREGWRTLLQNLAKLVDSDNTSKVS